MFVGADSGARRARVALVPILYHQHRRPSTNVRKTDIVRATAFSERFSDQAVVHCERIGGGQLDETESMREEFACSVCDSPAIVYPEEGEQDQVVCGGCGAFLATRKQFRRLVEEHAEVQTSGC
jgi:hypothetical protein